MRTHRHAEQLNAPLAIRDAANVRVLDMNLRTLHRRARHGIDDLYDDRTRGLLRRSGSGDAQKEHGRAERAELPQPHDASQPMSPRGSDGWSGLLAVLWWGNCGMSPHWIKYSITQAQQDRR